MAEWQQARAHYLQTLDDELNYWQTKLTDLANKPKAFIKTTGLDYDFVEMLTASGFISAPSTGDVQMRDEVRFAVEYLRAARRNV